MDPRTGPVFALAATMFRAMKTILACVAFTSLVAVAGCSSSDSENTQDSGATDAAGNPADASTTSDAASSPGDAGTGHDGAVADGGTMSDATSAQDASGDAQEVDSTDAGICA